MTNSSLLIDCSQKPGSEADRTVYKAFSIRHLKEFLLLMISTTDQANQDGSGLLLFLFLFEGIFFIF